MDDERAKAIRDLKSVVADMDKVTDELESTSEKAGVSIMSSMHEISARSDLILDTLVEMTAASSDMSNRLDSVESKLERMIAKLRATNDEFDERRKRRGVVSRRIEGLQEKLDAMSEARRLRRRGLSR